jgi:RNA polymerase sigma-70 factor, ECF subfamily
MRVEGNPDAFECLVRRHRDRLVALARNIAGASAEDAVQNALINAYQSADKFEGRSKVATWLHRIVINGALDIVRRRPAARSEIPESLRAKPTADCDWPEIKRVSRSLTDDQKRALLLIDVMAYPVEQAAEIPRRPRGNVKTRAARARAVCAIRLKAAAARR